MRFTVMLAGLLLLAGCGGTEADKTSGTDNGSAETPTMSVTGTLTLREDALFVADEGEECTGLQENGDIKPGTQVTVYDSSGEAVGLGEVTDGTADAEASCVMHFSVEDVPADGTIYSIAVAQRDKVQFTRAEASNVQLDFD